MNDIKITTEISTSNRYFTTLPLAIVSVANQTYKPFELIIYDDSNDQIDLRKEPMYQYLFGLLDEKGIKWRVGFGKKMGQVLNHQKALEESNGTWVWRLDDDNIAEPNVLEILVSNIKDNVGAVAGLVLHPNRPILTLPSYFSLNKIEDCQDPLMLNIQWFKQEGIKSVSHLYSTFIYRKEAAKHGYNMQLSPIGHREESLFTYEMKRNGWELILDPKAITWHFRYNTGGIRGKYHTKEMFDHDERIFLNKLKEWGVKLKSYKLIVLDCGLGDHLVFKSILSEIKKKYPNLIIAVCYPEVFEDDKDIKIASIAEAISFYGDITKYNIYKFIGERSKIKNLTEAFRIMYDI